MVGSVTAFDDAVGLGTVTTDDDVAYPFHCTQIADGSRTIAVGTQVAFDLAPRLGRWEAVSVSPRRAAGPGGSAPMGADPPM